MDKGQSPENSEDRRFVARLAAETQSWEKEGLVTSDQARAIMASYGPAGTIAATQGAQSRLISILAIFGAVLVGVGVLLFFAANWGEIPRALRLAMIMVGIPSTYALAYWLRYIKQYERVGTAVVLLGAINYGAGIHLVAQVYNFPVNDPTLFTYFFLGVIPLAYLTRSQSVMALALGIFLAMVGFWVHDHVRDASNGESQAIFSFALYAMLGLGLYGLGRVQGAFNSTRAFSKAFEVIGVITLLASIYLLGFRYLYEPFSNGQFSSAEKIDPDAPVGLWIAFYLSAAVGILALAATAVRFRLRSWVWTTLAYEIAAGALAVAAVVPVVLVTHNSDLTFPIVFNALLFLGIIGLVFAGYVRGQQALINVALGFFALDAVSRYFELSWDLLDRSLVFIVAGAILLAGGYLLERGRRKVFDRMMAQVQAQGKGGLGHEP